MKKLLFVMILLLLVIPGTNSYSASFNSASLWSEHRYYESSNTFQYGMLGDTGVSTNAYDVYMYIPSWTGHEYQKLPFYNFLGTYRAGKFFSTAGGYPPPGGDYEARNIYFFIDENGSRDFNPSDPTELRYYASGVFSQLTLVQNVKIYYSGSDVMVSWDGVPLGGDFGDDGNDQYRVRIIDKTTTEYYFDSGKIDINLSNKYVYNLGDLSAYGDNFWIAIKAREGIVSLGIGLANRSRYYAEPISKPKAKAMPWIPLLLLNDGGDTGVIKTWTLPSNLNEHISLGGEDAANPQVAMDDNGNAIITWRQSDGSNYQIFKSEYRNGVWTHPSNLNDNISPDGQNADYPQVAMDNNGNAIITWYQYDGNGTSSEQIFKSEYRNGVWTHPSGLSDNISPDGMAEEPQVAMDDNGNAIITWRQIDNYDGTTQIFKSEYRNGVWTHPSNPSDNISPDGQYANDPQVAMDNNGNAIITWRQSDGSNSQIFKSEYRNGVWTHPSNLSDNISPDGQYASDPQVAMDNNGNAIITWYQYDGSNYQIFKSEYRNGVWTHPSNLSDNISPDGQYANMFHAHDPQIAMDNNGNAIITWCQNIYGYSKIFKSEYRNGVWTHPSGLDDNISPDGHASFPQVAMDDNGNAIITWQQFETVNFEIFKSEYRNGVWTHPSGLDDNINPDGQVANEQGTSSPQVAMDNNGNAVITWYQYDGSYTQIFKSEYR